MSLPVVSPIAGVVYRWVARNRQKMPGGTAACAIDFEKKSN
jgi:predicted DCC family thiol-disulfide oxidoreductase YuxK